MTIWECDGCGAHCINTSLENSDDKPTGCIGSASWYEWLDWACSADALGWVVSDSKEAYLEFHAPQSVDYSTKSIDRYQRARMTPQGPEEWDYFWMEE